MVSRRLFLGGLLAVAASPATAAVCVEPNEDQPDRNSNDLKPVARQLFDLMDDFTTDDGTVNVDGYKAAVLDFEPACDDGGLSNLPLGAYSDHNMDLLLKSVGIVSEERRQETWDIVNQLDRVLDADAKTNGQELKIQTEAMLAEGDFPSKSYRIAAAEAEKGSSVGVHIAIKNVQMSEEQLVLSAITPIIQCRVEMNVAKTPAAPAP